MIVKRKATFVRNKNFNVFLLHFITKCEFFYFKSIVLNLLKLFWMSKIVIRGSPGTTPE